MTGRNVKSAGDIVATLRELPEPSLDELMSNIYRMQEAYERGEVDIAGRPIAGTTP